MAVPESQTPQNLVLELSKTMQDSDVNKDENCRRKALHISKDLVASLQTPRELAFETCFLPAYSACCRAAIHLRLFEAISKSAGPITASELATQTGSQRLLIGWFFNQTVEYYILLTLLICSASPPRHHWSRSRL